MPVDPMSSVNQLARAFLMQRRGMALLAATFPLIFLGSSVLLGRTDLQTSISAYYWTGDPERNLFVGVLCAIGVFLVLYQGSSTLEEWLLDAAGLSAAGVALCPPPKAGAASGSFPSMHYVFAAAFFACIFVVCLYGSEYTLKHIHHVERQRRFRAFYRVCSGVMACAVTLAAWSRVLSPERVRSFHAHRAVFWCEAVGVWAFSAYWYVKTRELDATASWVPFRSRKIGA